MSMLTLAAALLASGLVLEFPSSWDDSLQNEALAGCSEALAPASCVPIQPTAASGQSHARITNLDAHRVLVEVTLGDAVHVSSASRDLRFQEEDAPPERARAIGITIGLLARALDVNGQADDMQNDEALPPPAEAAEAAEGITDEPAATSPNAAASDPLALSGESSPWRKQSAPFISAAFVIGWDAGLDSALFGGRARLGWLFGTWEASASISGTGSSGTELHTLRWTPLVGVGHRWSFENAELVARLEGGAQNMRAHLPAAISASADSRWSGVIAPGFGVRLFTQRAVVVDMGLHVEWLLSPTNIVIDETETHESASLIPLLSLGLSWAPAGPL